tara:strand:+ start:348 stop:527 length:180 start_codon:yes stop_codon:yes gene_type:complete
MFLQVAYRFRREEHSTVENHGTMGETRTEKVGIEVRECAMRCEKRDTISPFDGLVNRRL